MVNKIMLSFVGTNFLFLVGGALLVAFAVVEKSDMKQGMTVENVAHNLILSKAPLTATLVNAIFVFATFLTALPAFLLPLNRLVLKIHGWLIVTCAIFTMVLGLILWFDTLKTKANLNSLWGQQSQSDQSMLQTRFECCGFFNSTTPPFVTDSICTNDLVAAVQEGCVTKFTAFTDSFLDLIFTAAFGVVGLDIIHLLSTVVVVKNREELERYRHIDDKINNGI